MPGRDEVLKVPEAVADDDTPTTIDPALEARIQRAEAFVNDEVLPIIDAYEEALGIPEWSIEYDLFIILARRLVAASWSREQLSRDVLMYALEDAAVRETGVGVQ